MHRKRTHDFRDDKLNICPYLKATAFLLIGCLALLKFLRSSELEGREYDSTVQLAANIVYQFQRGETGGVVWLLSRDEESRENLIRAVITGKMPVDDMYDGEPYGGNQELDQNKFQAILPYIGFGRDRVGNPFLFFDPEGRQPKSSQSFFNSTVSPKW
ncbi:MAG: hypothetical protein KBC06_02970 [Candidatus Pacebacteria bacterium]|nr:hypothetical protein [Candidatus Paceibacterota bacterium]